MLKLKNSSNKFYHELKDGWYYFNPTYFSEQEANFFLNFCRDSLSWESGSITLFGKTHPTPRLEVYFSENELSYSYSGKKLKINPFPDELLSLKRRLELEFSLSFNALLANYYRNGLDSNGWHSDNEKELGQNPLIASLSFGATRRFDLKHHFSGEKIQLHLNSGSLLIMGGTMQHFWKHQVPKERKVHDARINLTFRYIF